MRVAIDISVTAFNRAGNARYTRSLFDALCAIGPALDVEPVALTLPPALQTTRAGLRRKALVAFWEFVYTPHLLAPLARRAGADLLHLTMPVPLGPGAPPTLVTVLDLTPVLFPEWFTRVMALRGRRWLKLALRRSQGVITISQHTADDLRRLLPELTIPVRPVLLGSFIASEGESVRLPTDVARPGYLLSVGTLEPRKNLGLVLEGYAQLVRALPEAPPLLVVGGAGWKTERLDLRAAELGIAQRVQQLGFVPDAQLRALYTHAAALLYPSRYEGFGFPLLEAMGCGCPVITSSSSSLPEVVGDAGILIDPNSSQQLARALHLLLTQPGLAAQMRCAGLARAQLFSWQRCARETIRVYHELHAAAASPCVSSGVPVQTTT
jgi:alpha-1,3-rhamnosyl/mannosyltransferase